MPNDRWISFNEAYTPHCVDLADLQQQAENFTVEKEDAMPVSGYVWKYRCDQCGAGEDEPRRCTCGGEYKEAVCTCNEGGGHCWLHNFRTRTIPEILARDTDGNLVGRIQSWTPGKPRPPIRRLPESLQAGTYVDGHSSGKLSFTLVVPGEDDDEN